MAAASPIEYEPGTEVVPGYTLLSQLGSGMSGDVWLAQAAGGVKVAVKVVRSLSDLGGRKELRALKTIRDVKHPNLCPLFGFWTKDAEGRVLKDGEMEELALDSSSFQPLPPVKPKPVETKDASLDGTMAIGAADEMHDELSPAEDKPAAAAGKPRAAAEQLIVVMGLGDCTLFDRLRYVRQEAGLSPDDYSASLGLSAAESIRYLRASASAIDLLNIEHHIYHCDIKPQNILLVGGEAQVCDFGLAKKIEGDPRQTQQAFATPAYAAPEVLHNEGYSRQADQYSLAVTYFELRTGLLPFDITTHANMLVAKSTGKLDLAALSPAERKVLQKALSRIPDQRYRSCTEFISALAVASGVEKSGGIKARWLIRAVAALILFCLVGLGVWRMASPDSFRSVFSPKTVHNTERLDKLNEALVGTEGMRFENSYMLLGEILKETSKLSAESSDPNTREKALSLFTSAASRLVMHLHQDLDSRVAVDEERHNKFRQQLAPFAATSSPSAIGIAVEAWAEHSELSDNYQFFESAVCSANVRLAFHAKAKPADVELDTLRQFVDDRQLDFLNGSNGGLTRVSLLPLLTAIPADQVAAIDAPHWLQSPLVNDVIRAEKSTQLATPPAGYDQRWKEIRNAFTLKVSAYLSSDASAVSEDVREAVFEAFPQLHVDSVLVRMRHAVEAGDWSGAIRAARDLPRTNLTLTHERTVNVLESLSANHDRSDGLQAVLDRLENVGAQQLQELDLAAAIETYLVEISDRWLQGAVEQTSSSLAPVSDLQWIESELAITIPAELFAANLITTINRQPERLTHAEVQRWSQRLADPGWGSLQAAIELERISWTFAQSADSVDASLDEISSLVSAFTSADPTMKWQPRQWYRLYLQTNASSMMTAKLGRLENESSIRRLLTDVREIDDPSRDKVKGPRLESLQTGCAAAAVALSAVADDDFSALRYEDSQLRSLAKLYLELGRQWEGAERSSSRVLASEQFLWDLAERRDAGRGLRDLELPRALKAEIQASQFDQFSIPLLKALQQFGLARQEESDDVVNSLVIAPALAIADYPGAPEFGAEGQADEKQAICRDVLLPAVEVVLADSQRVAGELDLRLRANSQLDARRASLICQRLASTALDPDIVRLLDLSDSINRTVARAAAFAAANREADPKQRQSWWLIAAHRTWMDESTRGTDITFATDQARNVAALRPEIAILASRAKRRQAEQHGDDRNMLAAALQILVDEMNRLKAVPGASEQHRTALYTIYGNASSLSVVLAFEHRDPTDKEDILSRGLNYAKTALEFAKSRLATDLIYSKPSMSELYLSMGNTLEDLAHYCPARPIVQQQRFDRSAEAFQKALETAQGVKFRYSLARCQFRNSLVVNDAAEKNRLLKKAQRSCGDEPTPQVGTPRERAEWYLWRTKIEGKLGNTAEHQRLAAEAFRYAEDERCGRYQRNVIAEEYAMSLMGSADAGSRKKAIDILMRFTEVGTPAQSIRNVSLVAQFLFIYREQIDTLRDLPVALNRVRGFLATDTEQEARLLCTIAGYCARELSKDPQFRIRDIDADALVDTIKAVAAKIDPDAGRAHRRLASIYATFASIKSPTESQRVDFVAGLGEFFVENRTPIDPLVTSLAVQCQTMELARSISGKPDEQIGALLGPPARLATMVQSLKKVEPILQGVQRTDVRNLIEKLGQL